MSAAPLLHPFASEHPHTAWGVDLWHANELAPQVTHTLSTGHAPLDAALPGGGWPLGQLIDCLHATHTQPEWRLLWPALRQSQQKGHTILVGSPLQPHLPALTHQGISADQMLWINTHHIEESLWAAEQALHCHELGALLVWLPHARPTALRRLQLACRRIQANATQTAGAPALPLVVAVRPLAHRQEACAAPLRLTVRSLGRAGLEVVVFKRQGPPMDAPLHIEAPLPVWACLPAAPKTSNVIHWKAHAVDRLRTRQLRQTSTT